jgi:hypothetical protein
MLAIEARELTKWFRVPIKAPELIGALKYLACPRYEDTLAVDRIDLRIDERSASELPGERRYGSQHGDD